MFKWNRVLVALLGVPLLVFIYTNMSFKGIPLLIFSFFIVGVGLNEFYDMIIASGREVYKKFGICVGLLIVFSTYYQRAFPYFLVESGDFLNNVHLWFDYYFRKYILGHTTVIILTVMILLIYRVFRNKIKGTLDSVGLTVLGIIYVAVFFSNIISLYFVDYNYYHQISNIPPKITLIMILQILVWVSDTSAGAVGVAIGRKFFKNGFTEISPKKSVEGAIGSLLFSGLASVIITIIFMSYYNVSLKDYLMSFIIGIMISVVAQIGDLIESLFKRECGVKDSGTILMGHGGILDRFDSMLLVLPFVAYINTIF